MRTAPAWTCIPFAIIIALAAPACTHYIVPKYRYSCAQTSSTILATGEKFRRALLPDYAVVETFDECSEGTGQGLLLVGTPGESVIAKKLEANKDCHRVKDEVGDIIFDCQDGQDAVEITLEGNQAYLIPIHA